MWFEPHFGADVESRASEFGERATFSLFGFVLDLDSLILASFGLDSLLFCFKP